MANIKIKLGILELDSEGPEEFLKTEVPNFLKLALETYQHLPASFVPQPNTVAHQFGANGNGHNGNGHGHEATGAGIPGFQSTTENIAMKLGVKTGPALIEAGAARLAFVLGKATFTRDELHDEIKTATGFYNENHRKNLSKSLRNLVKENRLNEIATGQYAFSQNAKSEIENKLRG